MRRIYTSVIYVLWGLVVAPGGTVQAQVDVGLVGGMNIATLQMDDPVVIDVESQTLLGFGGVVGVALPRGLGLRIEPMFIKKGGLSINDELGLISENDFGFSYLEVPLLLTYTVSTSTLQPYLTVGPSVGIRVGADEVVLTRPDEVLRADIDEALKGLDYSFAFGGGVRYPLGAIDVFVQGRYTLGVTNINEGGLVSVTDDQGRFLGEAKLDSDPVKTRGWQVLIGFTVPLGS